MSSSTATKHEGRAVLSSVAELLDSNAGNKEFRYDSDRID